jgi:hypothetical protein
VSIVNRRNAVLGWAVWGVAKRTAKMKARGIKTPSVDGARNKSLVAAGGLAGAAGAAALWRKKKSGAESA